MADNELKILLLAGPLQARGSTVYTLRLAQHFKDQVIAARVVCPDARFVHVQRRSELQIAEYRHLGLPLWGRLVLEMLRRDLAEEPPDLIHVQSRSVLAQGTWLARRLKVPFVLTLHDYLQPRERLRFDLKWGRRIIAVSQSVKTELLGRTHLWDEMVTVIHSGVEAGTEITAPPVLDPQHVPVVGTAGPLEAVKGLPFFLGAAQRVLATGRDVEFVVAGAGPEEGNLRRLVRDLGISEHVTFVPNLSEFSSSLAAMDVYCLPSLRQGLGTIMLEAMALGKPVIASGVGGVYSVLRDNENGLLVPPSDSASLAEKILDLLDDPLRARAMGQAGRRLVQQEFAVEKMVQQTTTLYREVLETHPCPSKPKSSPSAAS
jgi:glycosyltransferase involved in cell wall biosynthesis